MSNLRETIAVIVKDCVKNDMSIDEIQSVLQNHLNYGYKDNNVIDCYEERYSCFHESLNDIDQSAEDDITKRSIGIIRLMLALDPFKDLFMLPSIQSHGRFAYSRNPDDNDGRRTVTTFGRLLRRQFLIDPSIIRDDIIAKILDLLSQKLWSNIENVIVHEGNGVHRAYENFTEEISCMSGECYHPEWIEIYSSNKNVRCLAVYDENSYPECVAKALLWETDSGNLVLDRVYCMNDEREAAMSIIAKARAMGAIVPENSFTAYSGDETVTVDITNLECVPYFDSFRYVTGHSVVDGRILAHLDTGANGDRVLDSTEGGGIRECIACGRNNIAYHDSQCDHCNTPLNARRCDVCNEYDHGRSFCGEYVCNSCLEDIAYKCPCCGDYKRIHEDEEPIINAAGDRICEHCAENYYKTCKICGNLHYNRDMDNTYMSIGHDRDLAQICIDCSKIATTRCGCCGERNSIDIINLVETVRGDKLNLCVVCKKEFESENRIK